jgi:gamma-glutamyl-gamma-aminobutyrate hydrolase PuuD
MNNIIIDANRRPDVVLHDAAVITDDTLQRITAIALPFLSLNATAGAIASVGMGACHSWEHMTSLFEAYQAGDYTLAAQESGYLILVVSSTALAILFPIGQFILSNAYQFVTTVHSLSVHIWHGQWQEGGKELLILTHQILHVLSIFYGTPEWIVLSLLSQAGVELYNAYQEYSQGRTPEALANLLLAAIRGYSAVPHLQTLHRNYFGQTLTQAQWKELYENLALFRLDGKTADVETVLIERGISSHIHDIEFNETVDLTHLIFRNMKFERCNFTDNNFEGSSFHHITADSCLFDGALWMHSVVQDCFFSRCSFINAACIRSNISRTTIADSNMKQFLFNDSHLSHFSIVRGKLLETSFLNATVEHGSITDSDLTDCLFLDTQECFSIKGGTPHRMTRPIVGIAWNFRDHGRFTPLNEASLQENGAIPLRFEIYREDINVDLLDREVKDLIAAIQIEKPDGMVSLSQELRKRAQPNSEIGRIQQAAASVLRHCHGLALPGTFQDIHPEFYGAEREAATNPESDYRRPVMEIGLIAYADQFKIPTMGTCRGAQMINIYFGGTLKQDVDGHWATFQRMEQRPTPYAEWIRALVGDDFMTYSSHHQAMDKIGQGLEVVLEKDGVPKLLTSHDGNFIVSQIHPEIYSPLKKYIESPDEPLDDFIRSVYLNIIEKNQNIYRYFIGKAREKWVRRLPPV